MKYCLLLAMTLSMALISFAEDARSETELASGEHEVLGFKASSRLVRGDDGGFYVTSSVSAPALGSVTKRYPVSEKGAHTFPLKYETMAHKVWHVISSSGRSCANKVFSVSVCSRVFWEVQTKVIGVGVTWKREQHDIFCGDWYPIIPIERCGGP